MITGFFGAISTVIDKIFPDAESREKAKIELARMEQTGQLAQLEINKAEAAHRSIFVAGWRPFIGWTCGAGVAIEFVIKPLLAPMGIAIPDLNMISLIGLLGPILGIGSLRTYEKQKGLTK